MSPAEMSDGDDRTLRSPFQLGEESSLTAPEYLLKWADVHANSGKEEWLIDAITGESYSFADFRRFSSNVADWFYANGMRKGDTVIYLPINFTTLYFLFGGVWRANGVMRSSYPEDTSDTLLSRVLESNAKWIYCEADASEMALGVAVQCQWPVQVIVNGTADNCTALNDLLNFQGEESPTLEVGPDDPALILCTSGTTGKSKGAVRTHKSLVNLYQVHGNFPWGDRSLCLCKGTHISGATFPLGNLTLGKTTIIVWRPTTQDLFVSIDKYKPDYVHAFPTFLMAMVSDGDAGKYDFSSFKYILTGGVVISAPIAAKIMELPGLERIINMYGLTETLYSIANVRYSADGTWETFDAPPGSAGVVCPGREIQIRDQESDQVLGPGQRGEICIKSGDMFSYYINNPEATAEAFTSDGYFKTGDIGSYDEDGCITVFGRAKEIFKYFNNHISPGHIDEVICQHPAVSEACTVGVTHEDGVNVVPRAFVTLKADQEASVEELIEFAHGKLASYMQLRGGLYIVPALPRGPTGKVTRNLVSQLQV